MPLSEGRVEDNDQSDVDFLSSESENDDAQGSENGDEQLRYRQISCDGKLFAVTDKEGFVEHHMCNIDTDFLYQDEQCACKNPMCCHGSCYCRVINTENLDWPEEEDAVMGQHTATDEEIDEAKEVNFRRMVRTYASFAPYECDCPLVRRDRMIEEDVNIIAHRLGRAWSTARREMTRQTEDKIEISDETLRGAFDLARGGYASYFQYKRAARSFRPR